MSIYGYLLEKIYLNLNDPKYKHVNFEAAEKSIANKIHSLYPKVLEIFKADKDLSKLTYNEKYSSNEVYPMSRIKYNKNGSSGVYGVTYDKTFECFSANIYYLRFPNYMINIAEKYEEKESPYIGKYKEVKDSDCTMSNYKKFIAFAEQKMQIIKPKIEAIMPFVEVEMKSTPEASSTDSIKHYLETCDIHDLGFDFSIIIKDEYTKKLLKLDAPEAERLGKALAAIKNEDKINIIDLYRKITYWLSNLKTINNKMNFDFEDVKGLCYNVFGWNDIKLTNIINKGKNNFKATTAKELEGNDLNEKFLLSKLGNDIKIIQDYNSGSGDQVILGRNKLWYINIEHNDLVSINELPFDSKYFDNIDPELLKIILTDIDTATNNFFIKK